VLFFRPRLASGSSRTLPRRLSLDDLARYNTGSSFPPAGLNPAYVMVLPLLLSFFGFFLSTRSGIKCYSHARCEITYLPSGRVSRAPSQVLPFFLLLSSQWSAQIPRSARILPLHSGDFPTPHHVASAFCFSRVLRATDLSA
jgi:hypothetical protein